MATGHARNGWRKSAGRWATLLITALAGVLTMRAEAAEVPTQNLIANGDYQTDTDSDGKPDGWSWHKNLRVRREGENAWLEIEGNGSHGRKIPLDPEWGVLRLSCRMRVTGVERGAESWHDARIAMTFLGPDGKRVGEWPHVLSAVGTSDWQELEREYRIPEGAVALGITPALFTSKGKVEYDDLDLRAVRLKPRKADAPLPEGAPKDPWAMADAWRRDSETRGEICLNGLWAFRPLESDATTASLKQAPARGEAWGWFKVPGIWPSSHWSLGDAAQKPVLPEWLEARLPTWSDMHRAWYRRTFVAPEAWAGRRIVLDMGQVQTQATVWIDGKEAGEVWFPGGELDVTDRVRAGAKHTLSVLLTALPLEPERQSFMDADRIVKSKATVKLRGLVGDVYLRSEPKASRLGDVDIRTSVKKGEIVFNVGLPGSLDGRNRLEARVAKDGKTVLTARSKAFTPEDAEGGRFQFSERWRDAALWDTHTPDNMYEAVVTLTDAEGKALDTSLPVRFGFREFRIEGRDFLLNEKPIHLRALNVSNGAAFADKASLEGSREMCRRLREYGFNFFIMSNYGTGPGELGYFEDMLEACDREGVLCSFSLPHVKDFKGDMSEGDAAARYRAEAEFLIRKARRHPSVVMYAMNHNYTAYTGDQNPLKIDGKYAYRDPKGKSRYGARSYSRNRAMEGEEIANAIDPTRPVYHHHSGNLGTMHTVNIYLNWAPRQERSDWLEHWSKEGVKPFFAVEWGLPHVSSWSSYRGPEFIWRCEAFQSIWDSEFAASYTNQRAYEMIPAKVESLRLEEKLWAKGEPFRWSGMLGYLHQQDLNHHAIQGMMAADNWRSHRAWGASALLPWDQGGLWRRAKGTPVREVENRYRDLQRPGIRPDAVMQGRQYIYDQGPCENYEPTALGRSFLRWNADAIGWIAGEPGAFTDKTHVYTPGEKVRKQLLIVSDRREDVRCRWSWSAKGAKAFSDRGTIRVTPGEVARVPFDFTIPRDAALGTMRIEASFEMEGLEPQTDAFDVRIVHPAPKVQTKRSVRVFDPKGLTIREFRRLGIAFEELKPGSQPDAEGVLVLGREALGAPGQPSLDGLKEGLRVLVFEQSAETLARLGFRINVHGLRRVFPRAGGHPALEGIDAERLRHWRGDATLTPPYLDLPDIEPTNPKWEWCGFENTRVWRCGNRHNANSVLIEKPPRGDWMPIVDGGFDLQYAGLLELTEGRGRVVFCQIDVTGRTETDPTADRVIGNLVRYLDGAPDPAPRPVFYTGDARGAALLETLGVAFERGTPSSDAVLVVGPGAQIDATVRARIAEGLRVLALGLKGEEVRALLGDAAPEVATMETPPALIARFDAPELMGVSNADLHWRTLDAYVGLKGDTGTGNEALRVLGIGRGRVVLCQRAPWDANFEKRGYLRTTYRRSVFLVSRLLHNLGARGASGLAPRWDATRTAEAVYSVDLPETWRGLVDREDAGRKAEWFSPELDDSTWGELKVPGTFDTQVEGLADYNGLFWYRVRFPTPEQLAKGARALYLGGIDDESWVWLNGKFLGEVTKKTNPKDYWRFPRRYELTPDMLKAPGEDNVLVVRVNDTYQTGGIRGQPRIEVPKPWDPTYYAQRPEAVDDPYRYYRW